MQFRLEVSEFQIERIVVAVEICKIVREREVRKKRFKDKALWNAQIQKSRKIGLRKSKKNRKM